MRRIVARLFAAASACGLFLPASPAVADGQDLLGGRPPVPYRSHAPWPEAGDGGLVGPCHQRLDPGGADHDAGIYGGGRPVAPADLGGGRSGLPGPLVSLDIQARDSTASQPGMIAGEVTVDTATGLVTLDGHAVGVAGLADPGGLCAGN